MAEGPLRTAYTNYALAVGRTGLQEGNLVTANQELEALNQIGLSVEYYAVSLDDDNNLQLRAPPWAPNPIPEEVVALAFRIDKTIGKIKRLLKATEQQHKVSKYLRLLLSYARKGLAEGDIKSAKTFAKAI